MQSVKHSYKNIHAIFDEMEAYYTYTSYKDHSDELFTQTFDESFADLADVFEEFGRLSTPSLVDNKYVPIELPKFDDKNIILTFSGGKDSVALAFKLREQGYNVHLFHVKGINRSLSDELQCAQAIAEKYGFPFHVETLQFKGLHDWQEHPMKNMLIANSALHYGIRENIGTKLAFGNYTSSYLEDNPFWACAGDCIDMWECYESIIQRIIPDFKILCDLESVGETLERTVYDKELLDMTVSCLCRHSLRDYRHNWVLSKYGVNLPNHRCGSCFKCCLEYVYMVDHDLTEFNLEYYKYCMNQMSRVCIREELIFLTVRNVWDFFMFYPMERSKAYDWLSRGFIRNRGIVWRKPITESTTNVCN